MTFISGEPPRHGGPPPQPNKRLRRELDVMELIAEGMTDEAVAHKLSISVVTVRRRIRRFRARVGATSRVQAAVEAVRRGWL